MKIVHIIRDTANPNSMNGVNVVVHCLATEQARIGHDVEVWSIVEPGADPGNVERLYVHRQFPPCRGPFEVGRAVVEAISELPASAWVQLHSVFVFDYLYVANALAKRGIAFGVSPHGGYAPPALRRGWLKKAVYFRFVEAGILRSAALVHALTVKEMADVRRLVPKARVAIVPNGQYPLELDGYLQKGKSAVGRPVFIYCGRLAQHHKGLDILLEGLAHHLSSGGGGTLWLVGDGPDRQELMMLARELGISAKVQFLGSRYGSDKMNLLAQADVYVQTSRYEGLPMSVLEAAAIGLPLLVSAATNLGNEVTQYEAGLVLETCSPTEVAAGMRQLETELVRGMAASHYSIAAKKMVEQRFSWPRVAGELVNEYLIARARASRNRRPE